MLFSLDDQLMSEGATVDHAILRDTKIAAALVVAASCGLRAEVDIRTLADILQTAGANGNLEVYANVYGRPVSYVVWGYGSRGTTQEDTIWFGDRRGAAERILLDGAACESSMLEAGGLWIDAAQSEFVSVLRPTRPKQRRTYRTSQLARHFARSTSIAGLEEGTIHPSLAEQRAVSRRLLSAYRDVYLGLMAIASGSDRGLMIGRAFPLLVQLRSIRQLHLATPVEGCDAVLIVAMGDIESFGQWSEADLNAPLSLYISGDDIIITGAYGSRAGIAKAIREFLNALAAQGEREFFCLRLCRSGRDILSELASEHGWTVSEGRDATRVRMGPMP